MASWVLITGGSSGIGLQIARCFWQAGYSLILTGLHKAEFEAVETVLGSSPSRKYLCWQQDLASLEGAQSLFQRVERSEIQIDILVNCAGFGDLSEVVESNQEKIARMGLVNIHSLTQLCLLFGKQMKQRGGGKILNVASTISFQPLPFMAVYSASKSYVLSFSQSLTAELKPYGVQVSCLCPGATRTEFLNVSGIPADKNKFSLGKLVWTVAMPAEKVAQAGFNGLMSNKKLIMTGIGNHLHYYVMALLPNFLAVNVVAWFMRKRV